MSFLNFVIPNISKKKKQIFKFLLPNTGWKN